VLSRVLTVGLLAGLVAGLAIAVLQHFAVTPMILQAETYENAAPAAETGALRDFGGAKLFLAHSHAGDAGHAAEGAVWAPADGLERTLFTGLATVLAAVGFALVLLAGMIVAGDRITERRAIGWGIAAFAAASLAPAFGLSPELPGSAAAPLDARQLWWLATAVATAASLWLFLRTERPWAKLAAVVLLAAPHLVGAPEAEGFASSVPAELSAEFAARSLVVSALLWVAVAWAVAVFWRRFGPSEAS
jgi:cobalt transporter subunit CbtA